MNVKILFITCGLIVVYILLFVKVYTLTVPLALDVNAAIEIYTVEWFYTNQPSINTIDTFIESNLFIFALLQIYIIISLFVFTGVFVFDLMSMCGSDHPMRHMFLYPIFWLPLIFYYLFKNLHKCCRCKNMDIIHVKYTNGQQFCYACYEARFKEPHTCANCGEKKLLHLFKEDGSKYCKECYDEEFE